MASLHLLLCALAFNVVSAASGDDILIIGDSWTSVIAAGAIIDQSFFERKLADKGCESKTRNIAVPGTTARGWSQGTLFNLAKQQFKNRDYVWAMFGGNDALADMPRCASNGGTAQECGDQLMEEMLNVTGFIADELHAANPDGRIVGFGYDTMFGGPGCEVLARTIFPQCWSLGTPATQARRCFNTQFTRIQDLWSEIASTRDWVDVVNLLGTTQVAGGVPNATIGSPNMDEFGPRKYWPLHLGCFHPGIFDSGTGGGESASMILMEEFYNQYWSHELEC